MFRGPPESFRDREDRGAVGGGTFSQCAKVNAHGVLRVCHWTTPPDRKGESGEPSNVAEGG